MQIDLFTCNAERNRIDKSSYISNRFTLEGSFRNESSALDINVIVEKTNPLLYDYNYMYISEFKRWYFINNISTIRNKLWSISATVDVLMTFKTDILSSTAILDKVEDEVVSNVYLDDGSFVMDTRKFNEVLEFPNGLNENGQYILICAGGD